MHIRKAIHKMRFYVSSFGSYILPHQWYRWQRRLLFRSLSEEERAIIRQRVDYYVRCLPTKTSMPTPGDGVRTTTVAGYKFPFGERHKHSAYFFDLYRVVRYFPSHMHISYLFGDVTHEPATPTIVKSRPIGKGATNSVVLKLNSVRHFRFFSDNMNYRDKRDMIVFRNVVRQPHRKLFMEMFFNHPLCDAGKINADGGHDEWLRPFMSVADQLKYKFVACIEGNDVATNLKWVMASNSVAVMPRPHYETWFREGLLQPGVHYIEIAADYHDLEEKLKYYIEHPDEAEQIISNAHEYVKQFADQRLEKLTQVAVLDEYLQRTGETDRSLL